MMIAHDELVARQGIERRAQLLRLRHREVAGIRDAIDLPLQERLARAENGVG